MRDRVDTLPAFLDQRIPNLPGARIERLTMRMQLCQIDLAVPLDSQFESEQAAVPGRPRWIAWLADAAERRA